MYRIQHPTKGFYQNADIQGGVWVGANHAFKWARSYSTIEAAEIACYRLRGLNGQKLAKLEIVTIKPSDPANGPVFLTSTVHKTVYPKK